MMRDGAKSHMERKLFSELEVCKIYGLSASWLRRARRERRGPPFLKLGRLIRYHQKDFESYLIECTVATQYQRIKKSQSRRD